MLRVYTKGVIISGDFNVCPIDIETELFRHNAVLDATVVGVPDEKLGEPEVALVVLDETGNGDPDSIRPWANARLAKHQRLKDMVIRDGDFPRNTLGKILKNELRDEFR